jgi:hypothetical protein
MGSVTNPLTSLSYLTQPGGVLSKLPVQISTGELQSASSQDLVSLSAAALQAQQVDGLFGISQADQSTLPSLGSGPFQAPDSSQTNGLLPGVVAADLANATAQQLNAIGNQALRLQQVQGLFGVSVPITGSLNVTG